MTTELGTLPEPTKPLKPASPAKVVKHLRSTIRVKISEGKLFNGSVLAHEECGMFYTLSNSSKQTVIDHVAKIPFRSSVIERSTGEKVTSHHYKVVWSESIERFVILTDNAPR